MPGWQVWTLVALYCGKLASSLPLEVLCDDRLGRKGVCMRRDCASAAAASVRAAGQTLLRFPRTVTHLRSELVVPGSGPLHKPTAPAASPSSAPPRPWSPWATARCRALAPLRVTCPPGVQDGERQTRIPVFLFVSRLPLRVPVRPTPPLCPWAALLGSSPAPDTEARPFRRVLSRIPLLYKEHRVLHTPYSLSLCTVWILWLNTSKYPQSQTLSP